MIAILCNCFNSLNICLILFFGLLLFLINKKSKDDCINKEEREQIIDSIERRSEECPQQYPNGWLPVCDSHDLKKGEVKPIFVLGRDLVIYRGTSGKVYVFDAYCPHLGANLGVGGTVVGDDIKCHFHGWQFNNQGYCNAIPGLEEKAIPKTRIRKWRSDDVNGFIYVWHHLEEKEPDWSMPKLDQFERFRYRGKTLSENFCHIQDVVENEADLVHFDTLHTTESIVPIFLQNLIKFKVISKSWKVCDPPNTHCTQTEVDFHIKIGSLSLPPFVTMTKHVGPSSFSVDFQVDLIVKTKLLMTNNIITLSKSKQLTVLNWYSEPSILGFLLSRIMIRFVSLFLDPDISIWNHKRFVRSPPFTQLDERIIAFRRWYKQFYSLNLKHN